MQAKDKLIRYLIIGFVCLLFATPKTADANILRVEKSRDIIVETSLYTAVFSTRGAALKSLTLNHYRQDCSGCREDIWPKIKWYFSSINRTETEKRSKTEGLVELVSARDDMPYPLALTFSESSINVTPDAVYETGVNRLNLAEGETGTLVFTKTLPGVQIDKIYSFDSSNYKITLQIKLRNMSGNAIVQRPVINWYHFTDNDGNGMSTAVAVVKNIVERKPFSSLSGESVMGPDVTWGGVENKYFIAAFIPDNPAESYYMASRETDNMVAGKMKSSKTLIEDGQEGLFSYTLFMGPKEYDLLIPFRVGLERSVDFGLLRFLSVPFLFLLNILYALIGSYGIAIVLMALIVKLVFLPLSNKTMRTMKAMQYLRPQIDAIKEQFKKGIVTRSARKRWRCTAQRRLILLVAVFLSLFRFLSSWDFIKYFHMQSNCDIHHSFFGYRISPSEIHITLLRCCSRRHSFLSKDGPLLREAKHRIRFKPHFLLCF